MTRLILAAGVAALAISAPAASDPGERGKGRGAENQRAERGDKGNRGEKIRVQRERSERVAFREPRRDRAERGQRAQRFERVRVESRGEARSDRNRIRAENRSERRGERSLARALRDNRDFDRREVVRVRDVRRIRANEHRDWDDREIAGRARGWDEVWGCPRGLAKKPVRCVPPGQVKHLVGQPLRSLGDRIRLQELPNRLRYVYRDTDDHYYRVGNGYVYRVDRDRNLISALLPLFGLGLNTGQMFPSAYSNYGLPTGLQPFYADSPYTSYRYANGYVYQIDPITGLIQDVDPMLGYGYGYGQMMPASYSAYNMPYQYRPLYYDTADSYYRYAPGAIYQVDPKTSLITAVAALLTGGMNVGQPLPMGYSAYNVPMAYRSNYYDTPDAWYRYANGNIYRVDPTTQLVTALVASILT